jgi:hypothetical protein
MEPKAHKRGGSHTIEEMEAEALKSLPVQATEQKPDNETRPLRPAGKDFSKE